MLSQYRVVEICAGAGGQSLGLELAGFEHDLSVELDPNAAATLRHNRPHWKVAVGDVASPDVWDPASYARVDRRRTTSLRRLSAGRRSTAAPTSGRPGPSGP